MTQWKSAILSLGIVAPVAGSVGVGCDYASMPPTVSGAMISAIFALFPILHAGLQTRGLDKSSKAQFFLRKEYAGSPLITLASGVLIFQFWERLLGFVIGAAMGVFVESIAPDDMPTKEKVQAILAAVQLMVNVGALAVVFLVSRYVATRVSRYAFMLAVTTIVVSRGLSIVVVYILGDAIGVTVDVADEVVLGSVLMVGYLPIIALGVWLGVKRRDEFSLIKAFRVMSLNDRIALVELAQAPRA